jgi:late competence protein required for DNA uptake (superfamily II DNA/RNA helicase)
MLVYSDSLHLKSLFYIGHLLLLNLTRVKETVISFKKKYSGKRMVVLRAEDIFRPEKIRRFRPGLNPTHL